MHPSLGMTWVLALVGAAIVGGACERARGAPAERPTRPPESLSRRVALREIASARQPLDLLAPPDGTGRLFVVEKGGRIRILRGGALASEPFLDLSGEVSSGGEQGLLGLAFHPGFASNGRFFVDYTDRDGDTRVVEFVAAPPTADVARPDPRRTWLHLDQPYPNHNGGDLEFGPDGALYIGTGDGGSANDPQRRAQDPSSPFGKMLRLDVDDPSATPAILAQGLRNPWRYAFDRATGDLYLADVGQDGYEEIDFVAAGGLKGLDFGWSTMEGLHCVRPGCDPSAFVPPVLEYAHPLGCSITGGRVYRGKALPELAGHYFYSDFCTGLLRSLRMSEGAVADSWDWKGTLDPGNEVTEVSSFGEDADGELYVLSLQGKIWKLVPANPAQGR